MDGKNLNLCLVPVLMALGSKLDDDLIAGEISEAGELALSKALTIIRDFFEQGQLKNACQNSITLELLYWQESLRRSPVGSAYEKIKVSEHNSP